MLKLKPIITDDMRVSDLVAELAYLKLHLEECRRSSLPDSDIRHVQQKYYIVLNKAILQTYDNSQEFDLVTAMMDETEVALFLWEGARAREPRVVRAS